MVYFRFSFHLSCPILFHYYLELLLFSVIFLSSLSIFPGCFLVPAHVKSHIGIFPTIIDFSKESFCLFICYINLFFSFYEFLFALLGCLQALFSLLLHWNICHKTSLIFVVESILFQPHVELSSLYRSKYCPVFIYVLICSGWDSIFLFSRSSYFWSVSGSFICSTIHFSPCFPFPSFTLEIHGLKLTCTNKDQNPYFPPHLVCTFKVSLQWHI